MKRRISFVLGLLLCAALLLPATAALPEPTVKVRKIEISCTTATVRVNHMLHLFAYVVPVNATETWIEWSSSNEEVVLVDAEGTLYGISPGTAVITASAANDRTATCVVTVPSATLGKVSVEDFAPGEFAVNDPTVSLSASELAVMVRKELYSTANQSATLTLSNYRLVSTAALKSADFTARSFTGTVKLRFRTTGENNAIQAQLTVNPADAADLSGNISPSVYTEKAKTDSLRERFEAVFSAPVAVIVCEQSESYGFPVQFAVPLDMSRFDDGRTFDLYSYDPAANTYRKLDVSPQLDKNGFLHFTTDRAGILFVTNTPAMAQ